LVRSRAKGVFNAGGRYGAASGDSTCATARTPRTKKYAVSSRLMYSCGKRRIGAPYSRQGNAEAHTFPKILKTI
jgi:hypothetical protein